MVVQDQQTASSSWFSSLTILYIDITASLSSIPKEISNRLEGKSDAHQSIFAAQAEIRTTDRLIQTLI